MADYRFEIVANEFLANTSEKSSVNVKRRGGFKRAYSKEIAKTIVNEDLVSGGHILQMELNLDGIFDHLPEELFHHQSRLRQQENLSFSQKHRIKKEEESNSRGFFQPFENEFSNLLIMLESYEKNLMDNNNDSEHVYSFFSDIPIKSNLKIQPSAKLNFFYPLLPYFRGDNKFLQYVLTSLLLKPISINTIQSPIFLNDPIGASVGEMKLGYSSCLGSQSNDLFEIIQLTVHALHAQDTIHYMPSGDAFKLIKLISQMIMPLQTEFSIHLEYSIREGILTLGQESNTSFLGYNSYVYE